MPQIRTVLEGLHGTALPGKALENTVPPNCENRLMDGSGGRQHRRSGMLYIAMEGGGPEHTGQDSSLYAGCSKQALQTYSGLSECLNSEQAWGVVQGRLTQTNAKIVTRAALERPNGCLSVFSTRSVCSVIFRFLI